MFAGGRGRPRPARGRPWRRLHFDSRGAPPHAIELRRGARGRPSPARDPTARASPSKPPSRAPCRGRSPRSRRPRRTPRPRGARASRLSSRRRPRRLYCAETLPPRVGVGRSRTTPSEGVPMSGRAFTNSLAMNTANREAILSPSTISKIGSVEPIYSTVGVAVKRASPQVGHAEVSTREILWGKRCFWTCSAPQQSFNGASLTPFAARNDNTEASPRSSRRLLSWWTRTRPRRPRSRPQLLSRAGQSCVGQSAADFERVHQCVGVSIKALSLLVKSRWPRGRSGGAGAS